MNLIIARVAIHEMKESISCLFAPSTNRSATGIGYSSLGAQLRLRKSTQTLMPFFLITGTRFDTHSAYLIGLKNPAFSSRSISSFTLAVSSGVVFVRFLVNYGQPTFPLYIGVCNIIALLASYRLLSPAGNEGEGAKH